MNFTEKWINYTCTSTNEGSSRISTSNVAKVVELVNAVWDSSPIEIRSELLQSKLCIRSPRYRSSLRTISTEPPNLCRTSIICATFRDGLPSIDKDHGTPRMTSSRYLRTDCSILRGIPVLVMLTLAPLSSRTFRSPMLDHFSYFFQYISSNHHKRDPLTKF
jgi:hypothetical protein